jgi:hypothetical protein
LKQVAAAWVEGDKAVIAAAQARRRASLAGLDQLAQLVVVLQLHRLEARLDA